MSRKWCLVCADEEIGSCVDSYKELRYSLNIGNVYNTHKGSSPLLHYNTKMACIWGCSSTCTIESNYVCSGGTTSSLMSGRWTFLPVTPIS